jgi:glycine oxidase
VPAPRTYIVGGGVIGLSLALQLRLQGKEVVVLERYACGDTEHGAASPASAGMLGVYDPRHPPALRPLAEFSYRQYPEYLQCIEQYSGLKVPLHTSHVIEEFAPGVPAVGDPLLAEELLSIEPELAPGNAAWVRREEPCLDPRQLMAGLLAACRAAGVVIHENEPVLRVEPALYGNTVVTQQATYQADLLVWCAGAWTTELTRGNIPTEPRRGQMLLLEAPEVSIRHAIRGTAAYLVPRAGGTVLVGSTVEHAGFDFQVQPHTLDHLHAAAAELVPRLARARRVGQWAGLRPGTPDDLPILGALRQEGAFPSMPRIFAATGHFRDGILLAPGTAHVMAQVLRGLTPSVSLADFSHARFYARY